MWQCARTVSSSTLKSPTSFDALAVGGLPSTWREVLALGGLLVLIFSAYLFRLESVVISDMDEGTYYYAGKLFAQGLMPYRDFLLGHPPLIVLLTGAWQWLFGSELMPARIAYLLLTLASTIPLYLIGRTLGRSSLAGLLSVATYMAGILLLANMGRTIRLEPVVNGFLIAGFACYVLRPDSLRVRPVLGALFAAAMLVKVVAVIPIGLLVLGDLLWRRSERRFVRSWALAAGGAVVVTAPMLPLMGQPGFVDDVLRSQFARPPLPLSYKLEQLFLKDFSRYPVIAWALAAAVWLLGRATDPRVRIVSLVTLGGTAILVLAFRTFFGYYMVLLMPWIAVLFSITACQLARRMTQKHAGAMVVAATIALAGILPLIYNEIYHRTAHDHVSSPARIVSALREGNGYIYSMYPSFALWTARELYPWYYAADSLIPRITGQIGDLDFIQVFSGCEDLVLFSDELAGYPLARAYVEREFAVAYQDTYYTLWTRATSKQ